MVDLTGGEQRAEFSDRHLRQQRAEMGNVVVGVDGDDPGHGLGRRGVERSDLGSGHRRSDEGDLEHARAGEIVDILPVALDEGRVLASTDGPAHDTRGSHQ